MYYFHTKHTAEEITKYVKSNTDRYTILSHKDIVYSSFGWKNIVLIIGHGFMVNPLRRQFMINFKYTENGTTVKGKLRHAPIPFLFVMAVFGFLIYRNILAIISMDIESSLAVTAFFSIFYIFLLVNLLIVRWIYKKDEIQMVDFFKKLEKYFT